MGLTLILLLVLLLLGLLPPWDPSALRSVPGTVAVVVLILVIAVLLRWRL